jgi:hypothetical protein
MSTGVFFMGLKMKIGSVIHLDVPASFAVRVMDATIATATVANGSLTITALKAGTTWLSIQAGNDFTGQLLCTVAAS